MKKAIIIIISIILVLFVGIVIVNKSSFTYDFKKITTAFLVNYNKEKVNSVEAYRGDSLYYIVDFTNKNEEYIGVLNNKEKLIYETSKNNLYNIKKNNKKIGFKNEKLIYEIKENTKDGYTYYYYDALNGEFIKKIVIDK